VASFINASSHHFAIVILYPYSPTINYRGHFLLCLSQQLFEKGMFQRENYEYFEKKTCSIKKPIILCPNQICIEEEEEDIKASHIFFLILLANLICRKKAASTAPAFPHSWKSTTFAV
jgi:hypothetical protein